MFLKNLCFASFGYIIILILSGSLLGCRKNTTDNEIINYASLSGKMSFSRNKGEIGSYGEIVIIDADKKNISTITTKDNASTWEASVSLSPDGNMVAYAAYYYTYNSYQIFSMSVGGGSYTQLTSNSWHSFCPVWNADGTRIFYIYGASNSGQIYEILPDGSNNSKITDFEV